MSVEWKDYVRTTGTTILVSDPIAVW